MSSGGFFQILVNLVFLASFVAIWIRLLKPAKDDPRLSRGLQLLQSKIAILEDLSDQVERQVQQVTQLIEAKNKDLQVYISHADDQIRKIESSKEEPIGSLDDLSDRQSTAKYVKAAQMAHQGATVEEIISEVDISRAEVEFVIKVNRHQLQFSLEHLPEWAKQDSSGNAGTANSPNSRVLEQPTGVPMLRVKDASISPLSASQAAVAQVTGMSSDESAEGNSAAQDVNRAGDATNSSGAGQSLAARIAAAAARERAAFSNTGGGGTPQSNAGTGQQSNSNYNNMSARQQAVLTNQPQQQNIQSTSQQYNQQIAQPAKQQATQPTQQQAANTNQADEKGLVKKVIFPRIDINRNLG